MDELKPIEKLARLCAAVQGGYPVPRDIADWVLQGVADFEAGKQRTLCRALGLRAVGQHSIARQAIAARQYTWLRHAYDHSAGLMFESPLRGRNQTVSANARCIYIVAAMRKIDHTLPQLPNANGVDWREGLYKAVAAAIELEDQGGVRLPRTARRIKSLILRNFSWTPM